MFGRVTITLGIGPHSSYYYYNDRSLLGSVPSDPFIPREIKMP